MGFEPYVCGHTAGIDDVDFGLCGRSPFANRKFGNPQDPHIAFSIAPPIAHALHMCRSQEGAIGFSGFKDGTD
jgi:hypothetical protein